MLSVLSVWRLRDFVKRSIQLGVPLVAVITATITFPEPALANPDARILLDLPLYSEIAQSDLLAQAESMVANAIADEFARDPGLMSIEVTVLGNRNGDVIPVMLTSVSRTDWQANPQVGAWSDYYQSYALFQRHDTPLAKPVAAAPRRTTARPDISVQFDRAYDSGRLTGQAIQANVDIVD